MTETNHPRWSVRLDAARAPGVSFGDLLPIVAAHFRVHADVEAFLGPYNARQRASSFPYRPPDKDQLSQAIKQGGMNNFSYSALLNSIVRFCEQHKGLRAVPTPHPSTIHSIQLPAPAFELKPSLDGSTHVHIIGADEPLIVQGLRDPGTVKFIIVRPKLSKLGTASAQNWEVLFYRTAVGYMPDWADSQLNPRYSGVY